MEAAAAVVRDVPAAVRTVLLQVQNIRRKTDET